LCKFYGLCGLCMAIDLPLCLFIRSFFRSPLSYFSSSIRFVFLHSTYPLIFSSSKPATKNAPTKQGGAEKALIGYFSNGQGQRKDTF
ncbi:MAG: hypothetical protein WAY38_07360, partial [Gemmiger qucibialis]